MIATFLMGGATFAQNSAPFKVNVAKFSEEYTETGKTGISSKTMENFNRMFAGATRVSWAKDKNNLDWVYCETKGKSHRAAFNKKGQLLYSITTYREDMLPSDVLLMVKNIYYSKQIFGVTEVNVLDKTAYVIILEDATSWLHIKVLDGEITEENMYLKAN